MPRPEKVAVVDRVRDELTGSPATLLTEYRGLSVADLAELRARLREAGARYLVVKNTLARIAAREAGFDRLEDLLSGPTALTICDDDPVAPAKALRRFAREHPELVVKGGVLEGRVVDAETADRLADLASREELLARAAGLLYAMLANTASLLQAPLSQMARLLAALEEERGGAPEGEQTAASQEPEAAQAQADAGEAATDQAAPSAAEEAAPAGTEDEGTAVPASATPPSDTAPSQDVPAGTAEEPGPGDEPTDATTTSTDPDR